MRGWSDQHASIIDYEKARSMTSLATSLSAKILDAKLALTRLRQAHPHPRLTVSTATATLDTQVSQMQELDDELQGLEKQIEESKGKLKTGMGEVERLRGVERERAAELALVGKEGGDDDPRLGGLYDWSVLSIAHTLGGPQGLTARAGYKRHSTYNTPFFLSNRRMQNQKTNYG